MGVVDLKAILDLLRSGWIVGASIVGALWFVFEIRADVTTNTKTNDDQEAQISGHQEILQSLKRLHEKEQERMDAQRDLLAKLCRQARIDKDVCLSEGIEFHLRPPEGGAP